MFRETRNFVAKSLQGSSSITCSGDCRHFFFPMKVIEDPFNTNCLHRNTLLNAKRTILFFETKIQLIIQWVIHIFNFKIFFRTKFNWWFFSSLFFFGFFFFFCFVTKFNPITRVVAPFPFEKNCVFQKKTWKKVQLLKMERKFL